MEAYIARGGISRVLSQARASLKNPSRPYTPRTNARPLFYGDDYRPESRPSSSYTTAEQKEMERRQNDMSSKPAVDSPSASMLPPRSHSSSKAKKGTRGALTESNSRPSTQLKLVHAPPIPYEAGNLLDVADDDYDSEDDVRGKGSFDPESSLALPSTTELVASYHEIDECLTGLKSEPTGDTSIFNAEAERLCRMTERFIDLSTFLQSGSPRQVASDGQDAAESNARLCARLFRELCAVMLDRWNALPDVVLEITPSLIQLFASTRSTGDVNATNQIEQLGKLLFMLSKDSANDRAFCSIRYVEAALDAVSSTSVAARTQRVNTDTHQDADIPLGPFDLLFPMKTLIYVAGTLKNLSSGAEERMLKLLATHRCIPILSETLLWRRDDSGQDAAGVASKEIAQFLVQATGILRNLSASKSNSKQFLEARISARLCAVIPDFMEHQELMVNVSRILSKLSLHERPRAQINETPENVGHLVALVDPKRNAWLSFVDHPSQQQAGESKSQEMLFVRVFFVLGNLCASNERNREAIAFKHRGIGVMLHALQFYASRYVGSQGGPRTISSGDGGNATTGGLEQTVEILVKLVRVLANIGINENVAAELNARQELAVLPDLLRHSLDAGDEELMLNAVSFITNLSFFHCGPAPRHHNAKGAATKTESEEDDGFVAQHRLEIAAVLARILVEPNEEAVLEAARTFGNLSRHADVLAFMHGRKVLDCFVLLLDHSSREIVFAVCGVLMNAALDRETRCALMKVSAAPAVVDSASQSRDVSPPVEICGLLTGILVDCAAADDVEMALMAGKALFNLLMRGSEEEKRLPVTTVATLRRVVESIMETLKHPSSSLRSRSRSGKRNGDDDDDADGGEDNDGYGDDAGGDRDAVRRKELSSLLPQLLRSVNSF